jgi:hypothetical protein
MVARMMRVEAARHYAERVAGADGIRVTIFEAGSRIDRRGGAPGRVRHLLHREALLPPVPLDTASARILEVLRALEAVS